MAQSQSQYPHGGKSWSSWGTLTQVLQFGDGIPCIVLNMHDLQAIGQSFNGFRTACRLPVGRGPFGCQSILSAGTAKKGKLELR
jgi:hypothetical protein